MKKLGSAIILTSLLFGCGTSNKKTQQSTLKEEQPSIRKQFFDYDQIDHYFNPFDARNFVDLDDKQRNSALDSIKSGLLIGEIPRSIEDTSFIKRLTAVGYVKQAIDKGKFKNIDSIFVEKEAKEILTTSCVYIYRDIFIFKKQSKVVGIAKICFDCMGSVIVGTNADTENFGQDGDYEKLEKLSRK